MIGEPKNGDFVSLVENLSTAKIDAIREENGALLQSHIFEEDRYHAPEDVSTVNRSDSSKATSLGYSILCWILTVAVIMIFFEDEVLEIFNFFKEIVAEMLLPWVDLEPIEIQ